MLLRDIVAYAFNALSSRKLRTTLTIIGIAIGPAAIVALVAATQGLSASLESRFDKLGVNTMQVQPVGRGFNLGPQEVEAISKLPGVQVVIPFFRVQGTLRYGSTTTSTAVIALDTTRLNTLFPGIGTYDGRIPQDSDLASSVVGYKLANPTNPDATPVSLNQVLTLTLQSGPQRLSRSFLVTGVLSEFGQGLFLNPDDSIFVPVSAGRLLTSSTRYSGLYVAASSRDGVNAVMNEISDLYGNNVRVVAISSILSTIQSVTGSITAILASVASISVAVAFMGITTTMFTSVNERTREIGVAKALGYGRRAIMLLFLMEAILAGFIGGVAGSLAGSVFSFFVTSFFSGGLRLGGSGGPIGGGPGGFPGGGGVGGALASPATQVIPLITPELILGAILMATAVGALAGLLPAWKASRLAPVEALRHE
ncbi:MAG: ABC transporter permease [Thaumarchaeota archaeon]|nr:ABC transporter permease [Nitrososphaerota archaeon]